MTGDRPISALLQDILQNTQEIVRSEVRLARVELGQEVSKAVSSALWVIGGAVVTLFASFFALWSVVYALSLAWPMWAAALFVAAGLAASGGVLLAIGVRRLKHVHPSPERTVETIKETVEWVKASSK
jgi:urea transporter